MTDRIKAKIAKILNAREVVISAGQKEGVRKGMYFDVLDKKGEDITDPETGEVLGSLERRKVRLKIVKVHDKLSIASTFKSIKINVGGQGADPFAQIGPIARALMPPNWVTKYQTIRSDEAPWEDLDEDESFVNVGDPVVQVDGRVDPTEVGDVIE